jgi:8-hydroxy-5-deazaflavin:NADPH oxidoreductase
MSKAKIGILGTGDVAESLARGFLSEGYSVKIGTRDPTAPKSSNLLKNLSSEKVTIGTFEDAAKWGGKFIVVIFSFFFLILIIVTHSFAIILEIIVLSFAYSAVDQIINQAGPQNFDGKVVLDANNPVKQTEAGLDLSVGHTTSGGEEIQKVLSKAKIVKVFNTIGHKLMYKPSKRHSLSDDTHCI